ncbi:uncharacterized protein TM35_000172600 [Trypanosoma theileri]|uniref:Uncharacterized protein n=1 Tax=Trypanosoma theileri TaxID=67003 RepID=A0A1X0NV17_9TRYP|nr:uncharacterized protein TM35_000172600 [Trypanosoma theileri]ORC88388.1 hypothetical protein TM35_000172600 [Trypanosoma theileri]
MDRFLQRLQTVVDLNEDDESSQDSLDKNEYELPTDTKELKRSLRNAMKRLNESSEKWEELHSESCKIEAELSALRLKFKTSRENWLLVHQFDQRTIEALLEERFSTGNGGISTAADREVGNSLSTVNSNHSNNSCDITYVNSLREQNQTLKDLLRKYSEERDKYKLEFERLREKKDANTGKNGENPGNDVSVMSTEDSLSKERRSLEENILRLEAELARQSESMSEMALQHRAHKDAWEESKNGSESKLQHIQQLERELAAWRSGKAGSAGGEESSQDHAGNKITGETPCESSSPLTGRNGDMNDRDEVGFDTAPGMVEDLARRLEETEAENNAREEALNALYQDVHSLRERNIQLEQQLVEAEEQLCQMRQEVVVVQDQYRSECERNKELVEMLERAQQQQQKLGRELAGANEERRKLRLQTTGISFTVDKVPSPAVVDVSSSASSPFSTNRNNNGGVQFGKGFISNAGKTLHDIGKAAWSGTKSTSSFERNTTTFFGLVRAMGKRRFIIAVIVGFIVIMTLLMQTNLGGTDTEVVVTKMQADLVACQAMLKAAKSGHKAI